MISLKGVQPTLNAGSLILIVVLGAFSICLSANHPANKQACFLLFFIGLAALLPGLLYRYDAKVTPSGICVRKGIWPFVRSNVVPVSEIDSLNLSCKRTPHGSLIFALNWTDRASQNHRLAVASPSETEKLELTADAIARELDLVVTRGEDFDRYIEKTKIKRP